MPRQIVAIVAGTCFSAVLLFLMCAIKGMRRFGALGLWLVLGLWLCGWCLVFAHMKRAFVMLHPPWPWQGSGLRRPRVEKTPFPVARRRL
jgi:Mn2+/Fe2+ NRAMP family transporter